MYVVKSQNRYFGRNQIEILQKWFYSQKKRKVYDNFVIRLKIWFTYWIKCSLEPGAITYDSVSVDGLSVYPNEETIQHDDPYSYSNGKQDTYQHRTYPKQNQTPLSQPNTNYTVKILSTIERKGNSSPLLNWNVRHVFLHKFCFYLNLLAKIHPKQNFFLIHFLWLSAFIKLGPNLMR